MLIKQNVALKNYSNYNIGGNALYFLEIFSEQDLIEGLAFWRKIARAFSPEEKRTFVLGGGTNVLFSDEDFNGLVIKNSIKGITKNVQEINVGAGVELSDLVNLCVQNSLSGLEWAGGLPGTVGGAIRGNAGAYLGETEDNVLEVTSIGLQTSVKITRNRDECLFGYRTSVFKTQENKEVIIFAKFAFKKGEREEITKLTKAKIDQRNLRHPLEYPNIGSTFKNVPVDRFSAEQIKELAQFIKDDPFPVVPAGKLIFLAGLKGERVGNIVVSEKHTNFLVNLENGKAADVKRLIEIIKKTVKDKFNVTLEEEIMYVN